MEYDMSVKYKIIERKMLNITFSSAIYYISGQKE